jgi:phosphatidylglycerophosphate synthase
MRCPSCSTRLAFSQRSAGRMGAIAGLTFGAIIVLVGPDRVLAWPTFAWFMLFAFVYGRILSLFVCSLDVKPDKMSLDPFPNQTGMWKVLSIGSLIAMVLLGLSGFLWKHLPVWGILTMTGLMIPVCIIMLITTVHNLAGKNGILRREQKSEPNVGQVSSEAAPNASPDEPSM